MSAASPSTRMPVVYLPHGGGPWPFVDAPLGSRAELGALAAYLRGLRDLPATPPKAMLVVSAHWEEEKPTVMNGSSPPLLFDYFGFPKEAYELTWPASGDPTLAAKVRELLDRGGFETGADPSRGFDHGTFVPLKLTYPDAEIPTVQLSLKRGLDPAEHLAMGRALAPLRDEGVFILGSGLSYHNLRGFGGAGARASEAFDAWLDAAVTSPSTERDASLTSWSRAPSAREAHPREEHLLPLHVVAGAAGSDLGKLGFRGRLMGALVSGYQFG